MRFRRRYTACGRRRSHYHYVVPANAPTHTPCPLDESTGVKYLLQKRAPRRMGPCFRRDDEPSRYSITACSAGAACARSVALVEPIMIASGIEHRMNSITSW